MKYEELERYPRSGNKSLKAWSPIDELILDHCQFNDGDKMLTVQDRFGALAVALWAHDVSSLIVYHSQKRALEINCKRFEIELPKVVLPLEEEVEKVSWALGHVPKSSDMFELYLLEILRRSDQDTKVVFGFKTKNFTEKWVKIASKYFTNVSQSKARKKCRLLLLSEPIENVEQNVLRSLSFKGLKFNQYLGVFSAKNIDYGTQFFLESVTALKDYKRALDLASGNGVIGRVLSEGTSGKWVLMDDSYLAVKSSMLNFADAQFDWSHNLSCYEDGEFDLVVTNPPFHFEYEVNTEISINLFKEVKRVLSPNGCFYLVVNRHLEYPKILKSLFGNLERVAENSKFFVLKAVKR